MYHVEYFPEPVAYNFGESLVKIPGLDGSTKMGKSEGEGNAIFLFDAPEVIRKKVMKAVTDSGPTEPNQPKPQAIENLFNLMKALSEPATLQFFEEKYNACEVRYGDMKKQLAEDVIRFTTPFRERILQLLGDDEYLAKVVKMGRDKAHESAAKTIKEVREIIGFKKF
jgi:tryptophanyl-tRNA synthetase